MTECPFCKLNKNNIVNTIIEESDNFLVLPSKGSLCDGYLLIVPKVHVNAMTELNSEQKQELLVLIKSYRDKFQSIYGTYPMFFEHGSCSMELEHSSSSIKHAHVHIVNHAFKDENIIKNKLNLQEVNIDEFLEYKAQNYVSYISNDFKFYITYNFTPVSQQMRIFIAEDLDITNNYNWRQDNFENNIISTINKFKNNR